MRQSTTRVTGSHVGHSLPRSTPTKVYQQCARCPQRWQVIKARAGRHELCRDCRYVEPNWPHGVADQEVAA